MEYFIYIIQSQKDNSYYIGYSSDVNRRLEEHNLGLSHYTSSKKPWQLVYTEKFPDKSSAIKREIFLKKQKNLSFYESLIKTKNHSA